MSLDVLLEVGKAFAAVGGIGAGSLVLWKSFGFVRKLSDAADVVRKELRPNSGTSLADRVNDLSLGMDRVEARQILSDQWLGAITADLGIGQWRSDLNGHLVEVNRAMCRLFGAPADDILGRGWEPYLHPEDRVRIVEEWRIACHELREAVFHFRIVRPSGEIIEATGLSYVLVDADKRAVGFMGITRPRQINVH